MSGASNVGTSPKFFENLPADVDEKALKKRFKELASVMHPDVNPGSQDANAAFQEMTAEYSRLQAQCRTAKQRQELEDAWLSLGGMAAATTLLFSTAVPITAAAVAAVSGLNKAGDYLSERSPARYAAMAKAAYEAYVPIERSAIEAEREASERAAQEEAALVASLRRAAVAAALQAEAAEEEKRTAEEAQRLTLAAHEPFVKRYRGKLSQALDRRIYSRIDRLAVWWRKRRAAHLREQRRLAIEGPRAQAEAAAARAAIAKSNAEMRREALAKAEVEAEARAAGREEARRLASLRAEEKAKAVVEGEERRKRAALAEGTMSDLNEVGASLGGLASTVFGAVGEVLAFSVSTVSNNVEEAVSREKMEREAAEERERIINLIELAEAEIAAARARSDRAAVGKAKAALSDAERMLKRAQREEQRNRNRQRAAEAVR